MRSWTRTLGRWRYWIRLDPTRSSRSHPTNNSRYLWIIWSWYTVKRSVHVGARYQLCNFCIRKYLLLVSASLEICESSYSPNNCFNATTLTVVAFLIQNATKNLLSWITRLTELMKILNTFYSVMLRDTDTGDNWTLSKGSQVSLRLLSRCTGNRILPHILPFILENLTSREVQSQGTALCCLAGVLEGPEQSELLPVIQAFTGIDRSWSFQFSYFLINYLCNLK